MEIDTDILKKIIDINGKYWSLFCWGKLYRKDILLKHKIVFDEKLCVGEDYVFFVKYLTKVASIMIKESTSYFHVDYGSGSLSKTFSVNFFESMLSAEQKVKEIVKNRFGICGLTKNENEIIKTNTNNMDEVSFEIDELKDKLY